MSHFVKIRVGRRYITMWNPIVGLMRPRTEELESALDGLFVPGVKKQLLKDRKEFKKKIKLTLDHLEICDNRFLSKLTSHRFYRFLDELDRTEEALKSNKKIYEYN